MINYQSIFIIIGKKHTNCGKCSGCKAIDCKICTNCKDMRKYGGPGKKKKRCINRKCVQQGINLK